MAKKLPEYLYYFLEDCLGWDPRYTYKNMFWWYAIYKDKKVFSLFIDDVIYFKVGDNNKSDFEKYKSKPFTYYKKTGVVWVMSYYELPEEILEDRIELEKWIQKSLEVISKIKQKNIKNKNNEIDLQVLEYLQKLAKWKVTTYKILADKFGVHPRKIASIMKYNKNPDIYPCYKVVSNDLKISGYSAYDWVYSKIRMLENDGIKIIDWKVLVEYVEK